MPLAPETSRTPVAPLPRVTILLATHNGARYLPEQLASYVAQKDVDWDLWVSDDGSTDTTRDLIGDFRRQHGAGRDIRLLTGPCRGSAAANFMTLLTHPDLPPDRPVALSDQDDVWLPDKLARALSILNASPPMAIYSAQYFLTDAALNVMGQSRPPHRPPSFRNALVQNVVSGHSLVMDGAARALVCQAGVPRGIAYHDWWLYQLISGAGGHIHVDTAHMTKYRQHETNVMGAHDGLRATLHRCAQVLGRTYGDWIEANVTALSRVDHLLTPENRTLLERFRAAPKGPARPLALARLGLYRQSLAATASFYLATALGRV